MSRWKENTISPEGPPNCTRRNQTKGAHPGSKIEASLGENYTVSIRQNRLFECNQKRLFEELEEIERNSDAIPDAEECRNFWGGIWEKDVKNELGDPKKPGEVKISAPMIKKRLRKMPNWKSLGPDGMQCYLLKKFTTLLRELQLD